MFARNFTLCWKGPADFGGGYVHAGELDLASVSEAADIVCSLGMPCTLSALGDPPNILAGSQVRGAWEQCATWSTVDIRRFL